MASRPGEEWYLVRTKPGKERWVRDQLAIILPEVFLPLLKGRALRWGKLVVLTGPLFPCYLFAKCDLVRRHFDVKYLPGVRGIVSAGPDPLAVPATIIEEMRSREVNGVIEIVEKPFDNGERVRIIDGFFKGFEAVFERYLSGSERVAILLGAVQAAGLRVVLPVSALAKCR